MSARKKRKLSFSSSNILIMRNSILTAKKVTWLFVTLKGATFPARLTSLYINRCTNVLMYQRHVAKEKLSSSAALTALVCIRCK